MKSSSTTRQGLRLLSSVRKDWTKELAGAMAALVAASISGFSYITYTQHREGK